MRRFGILLVAVLALSSCQSIVESMLYPESAYMDPQELYWFKYGFDTSQLRLGMSTREVSEIHNTRVRHYMETAAGTSEQWVYEGKVRTVYIYFENGAVSAWQG